MTKLTKNFIQLYSALKPLLSSGFKSDEAIILSVIEHLQSKKGSVTVSNLEDELSNTFSRITLYRKLRRLKNKNIISYHAQPDDERVRVIKINI